MSGKTETAFRLLPANLTGPVDEPAEKVFMDWVDGTTFPASQAGERPVPMILPEVAGIFVGGCVETGPGSCLPREADAHTHTRGIRRGWICFRNPRLYDDPGPEFEYLLWHEYAHVLTNQGHTKKWREVMRALGQPIPERYLRWPY